MSTRTKLNRSLGTEGASGREHRGPSPTAQGLTVNSRRCDDWRVIGVGDGQHIGVEKATSMLLSYKFTTRPGTRRVQGRVLLCVGRADSSVAHDGLECGAGRSRVWHTAYDTGVSRVVSYELDEMHSTILERQDMLGTRPVTRACQGSCPLCLARSVRTVEHGLDTSVSEAMSGTRLMTRVCHKAVSWSGQVSFFAA
ncbi:hypothetical protein KSP39_PZI002365 [Platanthera zijinensis]|uniref:Uncharacterized protein n=1 Tax=Platanthera zijinensis TaxID=2320716 RepID=A0AAP0BYW3_9ASPA